MIEVLHLIDTYRIGGPGKTIINSARYIDRARFRVHVAAFTHPEEARNEFAAAVRTAGIPFLDLPETRRVNVDHVPRLRRYIREAGIRIVHSHGYRSDLLAFVATRSFRRPLLVTTHHGWIRNSRRQEVATSIALWLCRRFDGVEVVSHRLLGELPPSIRDSGKAAVVHNGIVLDDYQPSGDRASIRAALALPPDAVLLGVIGRISIEKGVLEMVDAFAALAARQPAAHLAFIGEGPIQAAVEERIAAAGLTPRTRFVGHQRRIQPYYEALDLLVSPSRTEGISNVILEAMTMGCPVVATRVGGTPEILEDEVSGLLVEPQNPAALAAAIERVLTDAALRARLVQGGRLRVAREFAFEARMRKEEAFYLRLLGGGSRGAA